MREDCGVTDNAAEHRLYADLASWWPLISAPEEYTEEAATAATILNSAAIDVHEVLELGSGGGHNAIHLKQRFRLTLVDLSADMLEMSRRLNPECAHHQGDMRTLRLGRTLAAGFLAGAAPHLTPAGGLPRGGRGGPAGGGCCPRPAGGRARPAVAVTAGLAVAVLTVPAVLAVLARLGRPAAHHPEHLAAAGAEEPHQQRRGEEQE